MSCFTLTAVVILSEFISYSILTQTDFTLIYELFHHDSCGDSSIINELFHPIQYVILTPIVILLLLTLLHSERPILVFLSAIRLISYFILTHVVILL